MKVGVFGGTFDPPHVGHVRVAQDVADRLGLDRILWVTAGRSPLKDMEGRTSAEVRHAMVMAAVRSDPRFEACSLEIERGGPSYTVDTLRRLHADMPAAELYLIIGVDQYRHFPRWRQPDVIRDLATLVVMDREGVSGLGVGGAETGEGDVHLAVVRVDVSSSEIRRRGRSDPRTLDVLPDGVGVVAERYGLYPGIPHPSH